LQRSVPLAHNLTLRTHCHATEEEHRVAQALALLAGEATPQRASAEGHHGNPIVVLEVSLAKSKADAVWSRIRAAPAIAAQLAAEAERRTDDACVFYARFDKQRAYQGELALTQGDDAIHLRSKLAAFPAKKEPAVALVRAFLMGTASPPKA
jgi:RNA binding exosome subunit